MASKSLFRPMAAAVSLAFLYVVMGVWIRMMAGSFGTWQQVYLRMLGAGLIAAVVFRKSFSVDFLRSIRPRDWAVYSGRGFLSNAIGVGFFTIAVQHAQLSTVSFISSLPLLGLFAWLLFREKVKLATLPVIGVSIVGLALLTGFNLHDLHMGWGEAAALIGVIGFDLGFMMGRLHPKQASNYQNTTLMLLLTWVPIFLISMLRGEPLIPAHVSTQAWIGLAASSVLNVVALVLINYVISHLKAYIASNLFLLEGVFALIVGFFIYGEVPGVMALLGSGIILACAYGVSYLDARKDRLEAVPANMT
jgi:drug/metabolite transporter (DMT)-like permease